MSDVYCQYRMVEIGSTDDVILEKKLVKGFRLKGFPSVGHQVQILSFSDRPHFNVATVQSVFWTFDGYPVITVKVSHVKSEEINLFIKTLLLNDWTDVN